MDKNSSSSSEKETHDFMSVDSFSQLPFIRPAPAPKDNKPIRLFGIEFGSNTTVASTKHEDPSSESDDQSSAAPLPDDAKDAAAVSATATATEDSGRKFECHYCCRNFPTSQALGGHQNAHKRERQHAKRAHLQSALAHGGLAGDAGAHHHVYSYGLAAYHHRVGASPPTASARLSGPYPSSWNSRLYGGHVAVPQRQQPINGSPLPGLWRIPAPHTAGSHMMGFNYHHHDRPSSSMPMSLLSAGEEGRGAAMVGPSRSRHVYDAAGASSVHDHSNLRQRCSWKNVRRPSFGRNIERTETFHSFLNFFWEVSNRRCNPFFSVETFIL